MQKMKLFATFLCLQLLTLPDARYYHHRQEYCAVTFVTVKEWELKLNEDGTCHIKTWTKDSRYKQVVASEITGSWTKAGDSLRLTSHGRSAEQCFWLEAKYYWSENDGLKRIGENACLPDTLSFGRMLLVR